MKSSLAIVSLLATSALAKPLHERLHEKRRFRHFDEVDTVYTTVTATGNPGWNWGGWGGWSGGSTADPIATTAPDPVPVVTEGGWGEWSGGPSTADAIATTTPAPAPVPVVTEDPLTVIMTTVTMGWQAPPTPAAVEPAFPPESGPTSWASPTGSSPSVPSSPSQGTGPGGVDIAAILDQHNNHRANASVPALTWSTDLANIAAAIAQSCVYAHNT